MWTHHLIVATILLAVANICRADCQSRDLLCYECDSGTDLKCKGPFNETVRPNDQLTVMKCDGCCVKMVRNANSSNENVKRTCTSNLEINLFMVKDGTCMMESTGTGHMCFCEANKCNRVSPILYSNPVLLLILSTILVLRSAVLETSTCFVERCNHHVVYH